MSVRLELASGTGTTGPKCLIPPSDRGTDRHTENVSVSAERRKLIDELCVPASAFGRSTTDLATAEVAKVADTDTYGVNRSAKLEECLNPSPGDQSAAIGRAFLADESDSCNASQEDGREIGSHETTQHGRVCATSSQGLAVQGDSLLTLHEVADTDTG